MQSLSRDTLPEAQKMVFDLLRETPASKKFLLTFELIHASRLLVSAGIRHRHSTASEDELRKLLIAKLLPHEVVIKAYGFDPRTENR